eukprot:1601704-Prymnesium_polylepis.1
MAHIPHEVGRRADALSPPMCSSLLCSTLLCCVAAGARAERGEQASPGAARADVSVSAGGEQYSS